MARTQLIKFSVSCRRHDNKENERVTQDDAGEKKKKAILD